MCDGPVTKRDRENRDKMYWEKKKGVLGEEKYVLEVSVKYFGTKFKSYKVKYFVTGGVLLYSLHFNL
jgi:hypothetical protein